MTHEDRSAFNRPWLFNHKPALVAHRGDAKSYPENTPRALNSAVTAGVKFLEFDIQLSRDRVPFLMHDDSFHRTSGLSVNVFELDMAQISEISVGEPHRFGEQFQTEKPVTLESLCPFLNRWLDVHSFIEIKPQSIECFGVEIVIQACLESTRELRAPHSFISFREDAIALIRQISDRQIGLVMGKWNDASFQLIESLRPESVFCNFEKIPRGETLPKIDPTWVLYDIENVAEVARCYELGADLIESMAVRDMLEVMI